MSENLLEKYLLNKINTDLNTNFEGHFSIQVGFKESGVKKFDWENTYTVHKLTVKTNKVFNSNLTTLLKNIELLKYFESIEGNEKVKLIENDIIIYYKEEYINEF